MSLIVLGDVQFEVVEDDKFDFTQTTNEVAKGYFGEPKNTKQLELFAKQIRQTRLNNKTEFIENRHYFYIYDNKNRKNLIWTKKGVVRLGFFIKSQRAKEFRDWAEDYIVNPTKNLNNVINGYKSQLSQRNNQIANLIEQYNQKIKKLKDLHTKAYERALESESILNKIKSVLGIDYQAQKQIIKLEQGIRHLYQIIKNKE